nr:MAG TPA: hypothetical protein [Caudoviricetes sp.]
MRFYKKYFNLDIVFIKIFYIIFRTLKRKDLNC